MKLPLTSYNKVEAHPCMSTNCAYIHWYRHLSPCQSFPGLWHSESTFSWITFPMLPCDCKTDWAWKLSVCFAYQSFRHSSLLSPRQVISHSSSLIKMTMTRGDPSYKQGGGTVASLTWNAKILILTQRKSCDLNRPDNSSLQPEYKKHCKAWRRWVSRCCKHFTYDYVCGISMGFIHECCWMSLILQMDWCPLWGLNRKRPVSVLIIQLSLHYTVYKSLMLSVCKFAVILLCSLVNLTHKGQKANHTIDTVQTINL